MFSFLHGVGTIVSSGMANLIIDHFGRRRYFIVSDSLGILVTLFYQIPNLTLKLTTRCLVGFFVGFNSSVVMTYLPEVVPLDVSRRFYSVGPLFINGLPFFHGFLRALRGGAHKLLALRSLRPHPGHALASSLFHVGPQGGRKPRPSFSSKTRKSVRGRHDQNI